MTEKDTNSQKKQDTKPKNVPNDTGTIMVDGCVRIHDPNTKEVFVEIRT